MASDFSFDPETGEIAESATPNSADYSVSELSQALKRTLEDRFSHVRVRGEVSGYRGPHSSGHAYFSLKDSGSKLDAVIWRGSFGRLRGVLQDGLEVIATGRISAFPGSSKYQLVIEHLELAGAGALMALLEERRVRLAAEGLFDSARKKPLPFLPRRIGVITSPTGAVIRDILHRLADRFPRSVLVWPVRVQGETSAAEVAAAIAGFNAMPEDIRPDLLIVARGGGSLEDLWGYNDEAVVRAAAASAIPLISAVGHETDTTLIDFASDWRAPTPTAAAERAVPVRAELRAKIAGCANRLDRAMERQLGLCRTRLRTAQRLLPDPVRLVEAARQRLDVGAKRLGRALVRNSERHGARLLTNAARLRPQGLVTRIAVLRQSLATYEGRSDRAMAQQMNQARARLSGTGKLLESLSYRSVLGRGFAVVRDGRNYPVTHAANVTAGQALVIEFQDGEKPVVAPGPPVSGLRRSRTSGSQGSLF